MTQVNKESYELLFIKVLDGKVKPALGRSNEQNQFISPIISDTELQGIIGKEQDRHKHKQLLDSLHADFDIVVKPSYFAYKFK